MAFFAGGIYQELDLKGNWKKEFKKARAEGKSFGSVIKSNTKLVKGLGVSLAAMGTAALVALRKIALDTAAIGDDFDKMAGRTGETVETLSALGFAATQSGASLQNLEQAFIRMTSRMDMARQGTNETSKAYAKLGVDVVDSDGKLRKASDVLLDVSDALVKMTSEAEKAAMAGLTIGRRMGPQLLPMLNQGSAGIREMMERAKELGSVWSTLDAKTAAKFVDSMDELTRATDAMKVSVGLKLLPTMTDFVDVLTDLATVSDKIDVSWMTAFALFDPFVSVFDAAGITKALAEAKKLREDKAFAALDDVGKLQKQIQDTREDESKAFNNLMTAVKADDAKLIASYSQSMVDAQILRDGLTKLLEFKQEDVVKEPVKLVSGPFIYDQDKPGDLSDKAYAAQEFATAVRDITTAQKELGASSDDLRDTPLFAIDETLPRAELLEFPQTFGDEWFKALKRVRSSLPTFEDDIAMTMQGVRMDAGQNFRTMFDDLIAGEKSATQIMQDMFSRMIDSMISRMLDLQAYRMADWMFGEGPGLFVKGLTAFIPGANAAMSTTAPVPDVSPGLSGMARISGGGASPVNINVTVNNSTGEPMTAEVSQVGPEDYIITVVAGRIATDPRFRQIVRG